MSVDKEMLHRTLLSSTLLIWGSIWGFTQALPEGFVDQLVIEHTQVITGTCFSEQGKMFVWEKQGRVLLFREEERELQPLLDIREEVGNWRDHGLLGFALHPNFERNGYIYLLYTVDRHYLMHVNKASYNPAENDYFSATIGRLARYTLDPEQNHERILPGSRKVLIGKTAADGIPLIHQSHGVGSLVFGTDGSLLVSAGDGASYSEVDVGQGKDTSTYALQALSDGIITQEENVGAFRSQMLHSLNGKVLRIDPETGSGLRSNPFFDRDNPYAPISKVWSLGMRNPFRMTLQPGTGVHSQEAGKPGTLFIGDVGWFNWEELNIVEEGGTNLGWPLYEGTDPMWSYFSRRTPNFHLPLSGAGSCEASYFAFQDLIVQAHRGKLIPYTSPCGSIRGIDQKFEFVHHPPLLKWSNTFNETFGAYTYQFQPSGELVSQLLGSSSSDITGAPFGGGSSTGGVFYEGAEFPEPYHGAYFHGDFAKKWIKAFLLDEAGKVVGVEDFHNQAGEVVHLTYHPVEECVYYVRFPRQIRKITYGGNQPPRAEIKSDVQYGTAPLTVRFFAYKSSDPEGEKLSYLWDFGDGVRTTLSSPIHTFQATSPDPQGFAVTLTVKDPAGDSSRTTQVISLNNTPPQVRISSIEDSSFYGMTSAYSLPLEAEVVDAEFPEEDLTYVWETFFHHNTHYHPEPPDSQRITEALITPAGCEEETYWYRFRLTVTDPAGLSTYDEKVLFPDCGPPPAQFVDFQLEESGEALMLTWDSQAEWEVESYQVERSLDGGLNYETLDTLLQRSENGSGQVYVYTDLQPKRGLNQYRIKAVNRFGSYVYSPFRSSVYPADLRFSLFPNPSPGKLTLLPFLQSDLLTSYSLYDLSGRLMYRHRGIPEKEVPIYLEVEELPSGLYLFEWKNEQQQIFEKVVLGK